jgi:FtsZ-binding cell division protein ZapB
MMTAKEFRHYQGLYNMDPVVQRLCRVDPDEIAVLEYRIEELEEEVEDWESRCECLREDIVSLEHENKILREKIKMWSILESKE